MKTAELTGVMLDYWTARADGVPHEAMSFVGGNMPAPWEACSINGTGMFRPSTKWEQGGPIIERELIELSHDRDWREDGAFGRVWQGHIVAGHWDGDTALIAAMRAYVADKFGDTVPDEPA